jgi:arylsulfatase A-like enzyme
MGSVSDARAERFLFRFLRVPALLAILAAGACRGAGAPATRLIADAPERVAGIDRAATLAAAEPGTGSGERALRIDLDHEVREAWWIEPGRPVDRTVHVPPAGVLRFAVGTRAAPKVRSTLRVSAVAVSRSGDAATVVRRVPAGPERSAGGGDTGWRQEALDLAAFSGERVRLRFEVEGGTVAGGDAKGAGLAVANPILASSGRSKERPNLVLVSIDTLRADRLLHTGSSRGTAPLTEAWAREHATAFRQAVAQAPWTLPSHASLLTGLDPLRHGANHPFRPLPAEIATLAGTLRAAGYFTAAVTGGGWLEPAYGLSRGFERYRYWAEEGHGDVEWEADSRLVLGWIAELPRPFFLFVHTYDVHDYARGPRIAPGTPDDERARLYDRAVAHMDERLGRLLARLALPDLARRTAVVVTSDHGEGLGEEGDYGHGSLREHVLRVPLLVALPDDRAFARRLPGLSAARSVDTQVRSMDIAPTLAELAGVSLPPTPDGVSLLPLLRTGHGQVPSVAPSYFAGRGGLALRLEGRLKYRLDDSLLASPGPREALFDLVADPREARNLAPGDPRCLELRRAALRSLGEQLSGLSVRLSAGPSATTAVVRGRLLRDGAPVLAGWPPPDLARDGPDAVELRLAAGGDARLVFQPVAPARLEIDAAGHGVAVALPGRGERAAWRFDGTGWAPRPPLEGAACPDSLCAELAWRGVQDPRAWTMPPPEDLERNARLRALGYVR